MVKRKATLPWSTDIATHATHANKTLLLQCRPSLSWPRCTLCSSEAESVGSIGRARLGAQARDRRRILVLLNAGSSLSVLLGEYADDTGSNFVMDNCLVVFTHDIDTKFLGQYEGKGI